MGTILSLERNIAVKLNEVGTLKLAGGNIENAEWKKKSKSQNGTYHVIPFNTKFKSHSPKTDIIFV